MALKKLVFRPGLYRDLTRYSSEGSWYDAQWVRFVRGFPQKMGGWTNYLNRNVVNPVIGTIRSLYRWYDDIHGNDRLAFGTERRFYIEFQGGVNNVTPIRHESTALNDPFAVVLDSDVMTVTDAAHGATSGAFVTISGATSALTHPTTAELNSTYVITVLNSNTYTITLPIAATATDATLGGAAVDIDYELNPGLAIATANGGYGSGPYSRSTFGSSIATGGTIAPMRLWSQDNFGAFLLFAPRRTGPISVHDGTPGTRGIDITTLTTDAPESALYLFVSDLQRYVIVLGTNDTGGSTFDPRLIRWASQDSYLLWTPAITNSAGSLPIGEGDYLVCGCHTRGENIIWSSSAMYSLNFIGGQEVFGLQLVGRNITIASQNAFVPTKDRIYWMGKTGFYVYDGLVKALPSPLQQTVFNNINLNQLDQVYAGEIRRYNEIIWFFCSTNATVNDRYVVYNYEQDIWYDGALSRTAWLDDASATNPIGAVSNTLFYQESGTDDTSASVTVPVTSYLQSADTDIDDGQSLMFVKRMIPDMDFSGSTGSPVVTFTAVPRYTPGLASGTGSTPSGTVSSSGTLTQYTDQVWIRLRGRQMALRIESTDAGVMWRLGSPRIDMQADGRQ